MERAPRRTSRGGQWRYSDLAIETCLTLRTTYRLALRQRQGLMGSIGTLMGLDIRVPDYSTLSRRANGLCIAQAMRQAGSVAVHLVVDSTGLKIFGEGEWLAQKHKIKGIRRRWRKLHLGLDLASGAIVCADLTHDEVGDSTASGSWINSMLTASVPHTPGNKWAGTAPTTSSTRTFSSSLMPAVQMTPPMAPMMIAQ